MDHQKLGTMSCGTPKPKDYIFPWEREIPLLENSLRVGPVLYFLVLANQAHYGNEDNSIHVSILTFFAAMSVSTQSVATGVSLLQFGDEFALGYNMLKELYFNINALRVFSAKKETRI